MGAKYSQGRIVKNMFGVHFYIQCPLLLSLTVIKFLGTKFSDFRDF